MAIFGLTLWLGSAVISAMIFRSKNRSLAMGALLGFCLGIIGAIIAACLSTRPSSNAGPLANTRSTPVAAAATAGPSMPPPRAGSPPPGWYPDPTNPAKVRYWEVTGWTAYTDARPAAS